MMYWLIVINLEKLLTFRKEIEKFEPKLNEYETLKSEGNYVQAHNHIAALHEEMNSLKAYMEEIPDLILKLKNYQVNSKI